MSSFTAYVPDLLFTVLAVFFFFVVYFRTGDQTWGLTEVRTCATELCPQPDVFVLSLTLFVCVCACVCVSVAADMHVEVRE